MIDDPHPTPAERQRAIADFVNSLPPGRALSARAAALSGTLLASGSTAMRIRAIGAAPSGAMGGDR